MSNILITGANGQLGSEIRSLSNHYPQHKFIFTDIAELDICNSDAVEKMVDKEKINYLVNCAAYTAVDKAETDFENANRINFSASNILAQVSQKFAVRFIHISTDYVFDGTAHKPYSEMDDTHAVSVYGKSKLDGETAIKNSGADYIIIRTSWLYSSFGANFAKTILRLASQKEEIGVIFDQVGSPTYAADLASAILQIISKSDSKEVSFTNGIYHYSNEGVCSWYDFAKEIISLSTKTCKVKPIESDEYPTPVKRPHYSVLNKKKIKNQFQYKFHIGKTVLQYAYP